MKIFQGYTEGVNFKGVMKFDDILEMQNKAIDAIQRGDSSLSIFSGVNAAYTENGLSLSSGIVLWGGQYPASIESISELNPYESLYFVVTTSQEDKRTVTLENEQSEYYAYTDYKITVSTVIPTVGETLNDGVVVGVVPFFYSYLDVETRMIPINDYTPSSGESSGSVIRYNNQLGILYLVGENKFFLEKGVVFGNQDLATQLSGLLYGNFVVFGDHASIQNSKIEYSSASVIDKIPDNDYLTLILGQIKKNVDSLQEVAYSGNYDDLNQKLKDISDLTITLTNITADLVPLSGTAAMILSIIRSKINSLKNVAYSGNYIDLLNSPNSLSEFNNDLTAFDFALQGEIRMLAFDAEVPRGWRVCDGQEGTIDLTSAIPYGSTENYGQIKHLNATIEDEETTPRLVNVKFIQKVSDDDITVNLISSNPDLGGVGFSASQSLDEVSSLSVKGKEINLYATPYGRNFFDSWQEKDNSVSLLSAIPSQVTLPEDKDSVTYEAVFVKGVNLIITTNEQRRGGVSFTNSNFSEEISSNFREGDNPVFYIQAPTSSDYYLRGYYLQSNPDNLIDVSGEFPVEVALDALSSDTEVVVVYRKKQNIVLSTDPSNISRVVKLTEVSKGPYQYGEKVHIKAEMIEGTPSYFSLWEYDFDDTNVTSSEADWEFNFPDYPYEYALNIVAHIIQQWNLKVTLSQSDGISLILNYVDKGTVISEVISPSSGQISLSMKSINDGWIPSYFKDENTGKQVGNYDMILRPSSMYPDTDNINLIGVSTRRSYSVSTGIEPSSDGTGTVTGGGTFPYENMVRLTAVPATGSMFSGWWNSEEDFISDDNPYSFVLTKDTAGRYNAKFNLIRGRISVIPIPDSSYGLVQGTGVFKYGETQRLAAYPKEGQRFKHWEFQDTGEILSTNESASWQVSRFTNILGVFENGLVTIRTQIDPDYGTISPEGITTVLASEKVTIKVTPRDLAGINYLGLYFSEDGDFWKLLTKDLQISAGFETDVVVKADFEANLVNFTVRVNNASAGTAQFKKSTDTEWTSDAMQLIKGETVNCRAVVDNPNYYFKGWSLGNSGQIISQSSEFGFQVNESVFLGAIFLQKSVHIEVTIEGSGSVNYSTGDYNSGENLNFNAVPDQYWSFQGWYLNDNLVATSTSYTYTVTNSVDSVVVRAKFTENKQVLNLSIDGNSYASEVTMFNAVTSEVINSNDIVSEGTVVKVICTPTGDGYFKELKKNGTAPLPGASPVFILVNSATNLVAVFRKLQQLTIYRQLVDQANKNESYLPEKLDGCLGLTKRFDCGDYWSDVYNGMMKAVGYDIMQDTTVLNGVNISDKVTYVEFLQNANFLRVRMKCIYQNVIPRLDNGITGIVKFKVINVNGVDKVEENEILDFNSGSQFRLYGFMKLQPTSDNSLPKNANYRVQLFKERDPGYVLTVSTFFYTGQNIEIRFSWGQITYNKTKDFVLKLVKI